MHIPICVLQLNDVEMAAATQRADAMMAALLAEEEKVAAQKAAKKTNMKTKKKGAQAQVFLNEPEYHPNYCACLGGAIRSIIRL